MPYMLTMRLAPEVRSLARTCCTTRTCTCRGPLQSNHCCTWMMPWLVWPARRIEREVGISPRRHHTMLEWGRADHPAIRNSFALDTMDST